MSVQFLYDRRQVGEYVAHGERPSYGDHYAAGFMVDRYEERQLEDVVDERHEQNVLGMQLGHVPDRGEVAQAAVILLDHGRFGPVPKKRAILIVGSSSRAKMPQQCASVLSHCFHCDVLNRVLPETRAAQKLGHHFE